MDAAILVNIVIWIIARRDRQRVVSSWKTAKFVYLEGSFKAVGESKVSFTTYDAELMLDLSLNVDLGEMV